MGPLSFQGTRPWATAALNRCPRDDPGCCPGSRVADQRARSSGDLSGRSFAGRKTGRVVLVCDSDKGDRWNQPQRVAPGLTVPWPCGMRVRLSGVWGLCPATASAALFLCRVTWSGPCRGHLHSGQPGTGRQSAVGAPTEGGRERGGRVGGRREGKEKIEFVIRFLLFYAAVICPSKRGI